MGQSILPQQKSWSLLPPRPRNAIPDSIASHSSLFPSLPFSLSLSLSHCPISGDSIVAGNDPRAGKEEASCWRDSIYKTHVLTAGHFLANTWRCIRRIKFLFQKLIFVLLIYYLKYYNSSIYITIPSRKHFLYIYIYIYIIISFYQHGYPWPSLATSPYRSSPLAGLQGYIPYSHIAAICMFELVVLLLLGHMWGSIGVHHLWARPCFSSSVLCVWFV